ncbi:MAG: M48 family metallopeptidase [Ruminococcaceae bacterium]|nr:M48 family metallopeptidase [Oscillospiraceae bacterium]
MEYKIIYSKRKSLAIQVTPDGEVLVKAPKNTPKKNIEETVKKYSDWIEKTQKKVLGKDIGMKKASAEEEKLLRKKARELLPEKVNYYSDLLGVTPTRLTVTGARTRFGSCSGKNSISFSFYLMRFPEDAIDYVVVHELCHMIHHNHSKEFYKEIEKILPDYKRRKKLLDL